MSRSHVIRFLSALCILAAFASPTLAKEIPDGEWELVAPIPDNSKRVEPWCNGNWYRSPNNHVSRGSIEAADDDAKMGIIDADEGLDPVWSEWHKRIAKAISQQVRSFTNLAKLHSKRRLSVVAAFTVTNNEEIVNAHLVEASTNPQFNEVVLKAINSQTGNIGLLKFPAGSRRLAMDKMDTFSNK